MPKILIIDDEQKMANLLQAHLSEEGYEAEACYSGITALSKIENESFDIILTDLKMQPVDGLEVLKTAKKINSNIVVIIMTAYASAETAVEAMKMGAYDYIIKPFQTEELILTLEKVIELFNLRDENENLKRQLGQVEFPHIIGKSPLIKDIFHLVNKVAPSNTTVLLRGESGTGKELVARAIHEASPRAGGPLVKINCGALPETLLESELFGHEKGSFTGAIRQKKGRFELAEGGTIFLDEIGDISPAVQVKLLRVLQEKEFERVGGMETLRTDARIVAATNRDLEEMRSLREYRDDLYFRLSVFPIYLPPLRERKDDIEILVEHFLEKFNAKDIQLASEVWKAFQNYEWPGNVRELENVMERAIIIKHEDSITIKDLPPQIAACSSKTSEFNLGTPTAGNFQLPDTGINFDDVEKDLILQAIQKANGSKTEAAKLLGITRRKLYSRMEVLGINQE